MNMMDDYLRNRYTSILTGASGALTVIEKEIDQVNEMGRRTLRPGSPLMQAVQDLARSTAEYDELLRLMFNSWQREKQAIRAIVEGAPNPPPPDETPPETEEDPQP